MIKTIIKIIFSLLALALIGLCGILIWLYTGTFSSTKQGVFDRFNLPIALLDNKPIGVKHFLYRYVAAQKMAEQSNSQVDSKALKQSIYNQLILDQETLLLANEHLSTPSQADIDAEYQKRAEQNKLSSNSSFESVLATFNLTPETYKEESIKPFLADLNLKIWFYSQPNLNTDLYAKAQNILNQLSSGTSFEQLAKQYSDDQEGKSVEGDLGFVNESDLLPELKEQVDSLSIGSVKVTHSRYGLHIFKLLAKNAQQVQLKQIFLSGDSYNDWLKSESSTIKIKKLIDSF